MIALNFLAVSHEGSWRAGPGSDAPHRWCKLQRFDAAPGGLAPRPPRMRPGYPGSRLSCHSEAAASPSVRPEPLCAGVSRTRTRRLNTAALTSGLAQILEELADLRPVVDVEEVDRLSKDFAWFSPILAPQLKDKRGDAAFSPASVEEIRRIVAACVRHRVPLSVRGGGTGNYGQLTPLHGGVIISLLRFNKVNWIHPGVARAQAGIRLGQLNREALASGWELRMLPSTYKIASLGGFYSGGTGGIGSINYGVFAARGNVLGVEIMTLEEEPRIIELRGDRVGLLQHCWGTAGIVLELEINSVGLGNKKALTPEFLAAKREFDPFGLMNPGKLAGVNEHPIIA
jgi:hypothetical protein